MWKEVSVGGPCWGGRELPSREVNPDEYLVFKWGDDPPGGLSKSNNIELNNNNVFF
jgi:hypothetical protein